ncbi:MAG: hypothetical protein HY904_11285 [Deltaproteobacteria bacterium]|nr:hypothetical protein [Deltaproteobacteria bacterium]
MSRRKRRDHPDRSPPTDAPPAAAEPAAGPGLAELALDRLAARVHPELFLALQAQLPEGDARWLTLFAHGFDDEGNMSPLLGLQPVALHPVAFELGGGRLDGPATVLRLVDVFTAQPRRLAGWQARVTFAVVTALGPHRCDALGRDGMGEVIGAVEQQLAAPGFLLPMGTDTAPLPLDAAAVAREVEAAFPGALARARLGEALQLAFPDEDDETLDELVAESLRALQVRVAPAPPYAVEVAAAGREWLPLQAVLDALKRRLTGGLRVLR